MCVFQEQSGLVRAGSIARMDVVSYAQHWLTAKAHVRSGGNFNERYFRLLCLYLSRAGGVVCSTGSSIIQRAFQGAVRVTTIKADEGDDEVRIAKYAHVHANVHCAMRVFVDVHC